MKWIVTDVRRGLFWQEQPQAERLDDCMKNVTVYEDARYQTFDGFGGAFTEAAGVAYAALSGAQKEAFIEAYFGESGLRYALGRLHIGSCDFALGNYAYAWNERLEPFCVDRDERYILPLLRAALCRRPLSLLASPWSPPACMKTNGEMNHGGRLKRECYCAWAEYVAKYLDAYRAMGIRIDRITVQNEPEAVQQWDSCLYTAREEAELVRTALAPALKRHGLEDVGIFIWDHNKEGLPRRVEGVMRDPEAARQVKGAAFHWYTGDHFESVALVRERYPQLKLYFTEGCVEYSRFADSTETCKAEMYAHDIIGNLNAGINGSIDWNLMLQADGGPNHVGNFCAAPIMASEDGQTFEKRLSYYYIGHFSRYIQPGARRLATSRYTSALEICAFENPDGTHAAVLLNRTPREVPLSLLAGGGAWGLSLAGHSIGTLCW